MAGEDGSFAIYSAEFLHEATHIGVTHVPHKLELFRTPLGGFITHSEDPNCIILTAGDVWVLFTMEDIYPHVPLTVDFRLYNLE